jgi:signal transduction histidine kinase
MPLPVVSGHAANLKYTRILRYALPLSLFLVATAFEMWEHWVRHNSLAVDPQGLLEVFIFGVAGPLAVYAALTYVERLIHTLDRANSNIASLNRDLERKVTERTGELQLANLRLRELDQAKSDFVSMVSHELRAPLATLNGGLEVALQFESSLPPKAQRILHLLLDETARLTSFVQTILDVSQLETGRLQLNCGPVAVKPLLHHALDLVFGPEDPRIVWHAPADIPPVMVDEIYTEQVVRNLLRNAQKYAPPQSSIELSVAVEAQRLCIGVTDHGPGVPAGDQARVFERFARLPQGKGDRPPGWGLGLYFARALVEAQGGTLTLQSPVYADPAAPGSRFLICLPIDQEILTEETAMLAANTLVNGAVVSGGVADGRTPAGR